MGLSVKLRGQSVATFRFIEVTLMETLAAWVPSTPEMEVKLLFGEHIWDCAQHADSFGRRTHELRLPQQHSLRPSSEYLDFLERLASIKATTERISGFYEVMLPALGARYRRYLDETDGLMDAPTVRIIERVLVDHTRMIKQCSDMIEELPVLRQHVAGWVSDFIASEAAIVGILAPEALVLEAPTPEAETRT